MKEIQQEIEQGILSFEVLIKLSQDEGVSELIKKEIEKWQKK